MKDPRKEVEELRAGVNCATVLGSASPPWLVDEKESSRRRLKYRRGAATVLARANESDSRRFVGGRWASNPSTWAISCSRRRR